MVNSQGLWHECVLDPWVKHKAERACFFDMESTTMEGSPPCGGRVAEHLGMGSQHQSLKVSAWARERASA